LADQRGGWKLVPPVPPGKRLDFLVYWWGKTSLHEANTAFSLHTVPPGEARGLLAEPSSMISLENLTNLLCVLKRLGTANLANSATGTSQGCFHRIGNWRKYSHFTLLKP